MDNAVTLKPGETYSLVLKGLGSAGYAWTYEVTGQQEAVTVAFAVPASADQPTNPPRIGRSVNHELVVKAVSPGAVTIHMVLRRPWEKDKPPVEEKSIKVTVKD